MKYANPSDSQVLLDSLAWLAICCWPSNKKMNNLNRQEVAFDSVQT